ncbi:hypothetical protein HNP12_003757 [Aeromonas hydrophila]|uniref:hypothetical protein n=1 Tax=Aeromonas hydrophila TaxID=644 RepID=UPI001C795743|nr:hypothetical protein [Aeromonas hydrophila]HDT5893623.1 hypothetical protein [Aeromonas hydrophila subsp. hydrophila]MCS3769635.1 hypothetical protein [Aeromonas hydrophila]MCS3793862.1 hypothetical protein [Aeromonas hydrophila]MDE8810198.1 hypothetical protein [Aeromonas hydrophila]QWL73679.1 hypothetical protein HQ396_06115 [Aeromonas hydrophila]
MNPEKIQSDIDALLTYMNDCMESLGSTIKTIYFEFNNDESDRVAIDKKLGWPEEHLFRILNICNSRGLVMKAFGGFSNIQLTEEGQSRAISIKHGRNRSYELGASMQISTLNVNAPSQIGNGNTQSISNVFNQLVQDIDNSQASAEEKDEAKKRLAKFLEHPLVSSIVGGVAGSLTGLF